MGKGLGSNYLNIYPFKKMSWVQKSRLVTIYWIAIKSRLKILLETIKYISAEVFLGVFLVKSFSSKKSNLSDYHYKWLNY